MQAMCGWEGKAWESGRAGAKGRESGGLAVRGRSTSVQYAGWWHGWTDMGQAWDGQGSAEGSSLAAARAL